MTASSKIKQNLADECQTGLNALVNQHLHASYTYKSMQCYFDRDDVKLPGLSAYFKRFADDEHENAGRLMRYLNERGGRLVFYPIAAPAKEQWETSLSALCLTLALKKNQNQQYLQLQSRAELLHDAHLCDFVQSRFLRSQVEVLKELADLVTRLTRAGAQGLGEYLFDSDLLTAAR